ncbi:MAG: polysaccharide biosynthesis tyrosine autokinase [Cyanobacteria bacterium J06631_9]
MKTETALAMPEFSAPVVPMMFPEEEEGGLNVGALLKTLQRKWWLILGMTVATTALAGGKVLTDTPVYKGQVEILVQEQSTETEVISDVPDTLTTRSAEIVDGDLLKLLKSPAVLQPVIDGIRNRNATFCPPPAQGSANYDPCYELLANSLSVGRAGKGSQIIRSSFQSLDPQTVSIVLDLISQAYLDYSLASKQADIRRGVDFVEQKLPDLRAKVNALQGQLQALRLDNNLIDPGSRGSQLSGQVSTFSQQLLEVQSQLRLTEALYVDLQQNSGGPQEQESSSALNQNSRYQTLLNNILDLDAQIAEASTLYLEASPDMEVLKEQRANLLTLLARQEEQTQRETLRQIEELEERERSLQTTIQEINAGVDELSGISRDFTDIERELQIATSNLNQFLSKREALQIEAAQREVPWEVVTPPTQPTPQPESLPQNLLLGGILGLVLGTGLSLLLDKSAGVIYSDDDIRRSTRLPILARIPRHDVLSGSEFQEEFVESLQLVGPDGQIEVNPDGSGKGKKTTRNAYDSDPFSESFRLLLTNLRRLNPGQPTQSVTVSSTMPGEGKSTVAIYLAEAAAAMGQRVLLIDADLRNPQIHQYLELPNEKGLTTLFSGESNPAVIQKLSTVPNMYVICAGSYPIEPSSVLASRGMQRLMGKVRPLFDLIIFDTPPLLGQTDAYLVANQTDGLLLMAQAGKLKEPQLNRAMEQLRLASVNVLGVVSRNG